MTKPPLLKKQKMIHNTPRLVGTSLFIFLLSFLGIYLGMKSAFIDWKNTPEIENRFAISPQVKKVQKGDTLFLKIPWNPDLQPAILLDDTPKLTDRELLICRWPFRSGVNLSFQRKETTDTTLFISPGKQGKSEWRNYKDSLSKNWKHWVPKESAFPEIQNPWLIFSPPLDTLCVLKEEISLSLQSL